VGPKVGLEAVAKGKIPCPCRKSNPGRPSRRLVTILTDIIYPKQGMSYLLCDYSCDDVMSCSPVPGAARLRH